MAGPEPPWPPFQGLQSRPLLKFENEEGSGDETAYLATEGLDSLDALPESATLFPIILFGDGRGGKSYLSSRLLGVPDAFVSNDTAEPVTEGIDVATAPLEPLLRHAGMKASSREQQFLLLLDCEGGNNAMAEIRTLVNVFGVLIGTEVVFVASGMVSEQSLQTLGTCLAARSLVRVGDASERLQQQLIFVVNKSTLRYGKNAFEQVLDAKYQGARKELRQEIREAFPERSFHTVPLMSDPDFENQIAEFRTNVLERRRPLMMGGVPVRKSQLRGLLELIVAEVQRTNQISFPSVNRYVVFDGFLMPLVRQLGAEGMERLSPQIEDYNPELAARDCRADFLANFDAQVSHIGHRELVMEARQELNDRLDSAWQDLQRKNEALGNEITEVVSETREVIVSTSAPEPLGGNSLLRMIPVSTQLARREVCSVIHRRRGTTEHSEWQCTGEDITTMVESSLEGYAKLPQHEERLWKKSPHFASKVLSFGKGRWQDRLVLLKDCHFLWYDVSEEASGSEEDSGYINLLLNDAEIVANATPTSFTIRPAALGWEEPLSFSGGKTRTFSFDCSADAGGQVDADARRLRLDNRPGLRRTLQELCCATEKTLANADRRSLGGGGNQRRDEWVRALREHVAFAAAVREQLGQELLFKVFGDAPKYALDSVRGGWH